jgi:hypothetical protein
MVSRSKDTEEYNEYSEIAQLTVLQLCVNDEREVRKRCKEAASKGRVSPIR